MPTAVTDDATATRRRAARSLRGLYAVTPDIADTGVLAAAVAAAIAGGATAIQYRNKSAGGPLRREQATTLAQICAAQRALFFVNDDPGLAREVGASGVHLGEDDAPLADARAAVGDSMLVGVSCYGDLARARRLVADGADLIAFGSFFPSTVKPGARRADLSLLAEARALAVPVIAIGGITAANAGGLAAAGADAVAVITAVFGNGDPASVTRAAAEIVAAFAARSTLSGKP